MTNKIAIIGGGFTGLAAAYELTKNGSPVDIYESEDELGGLAGTFEIVPGVRLEKFYHHWFTSDTSIIDLAKEIGLKDDLKYIKSNTGLYYANNRFRLSSPWDLLGFKPIPFLDRVRTGLMVLFARKISKWEKLESISAEDWIRKIGGKRAYDVIWRPLMQGKFGSEAPNVSAVWFWNKLKLRGSSRNDQGEEQLVYFEGGFQKLTTSLAAWLKERGCTIHTSKPVQEIVSEQGNISGIRVDSEVIPYQKVLVTTPLPIYLKLAPQLPLDYVQQVKKIRFLGNVCLVLRLKKSLSDTYWLNVADPTFPFVGVIEHTNFDRPEGLQGQHVAFISKYLPTSDQLFQLSNEQYFEYCIEPIKKIFPEFSKDWVLGYSVWRADYSQPVITQHYSKLIPDDQTPIEGLWLKTMAQIYPEDRGTNYAVREGRAVAKKMLNKLD